MTIVYLSDSIYQYTLLYVTNRLWPDAISCRATTVKALDDWSYGPVLSPIYHINCTLSNLHVEPRYSANLHCAVSIATITHQYLVLYTPSTSRVIALFPLFCLVKRCSYQLNRPQFTPMGTANAVFRTRATVFGTQYNIAFCSSSHNGSGKGDIDHVLYNNDNEPWLYQEFPPHY